MDSGASPGQRSWSMPGRTGFRCKKKAAKSRKRGSPRRPYFSGSERRGERSGTLTTEVVPIVPRLLMFARGTFVLFHALGAGDETRTHDIQLGKLMFYRTPVRKCHLLIMKLTFSPAEIQNYCSDRPSSGDCTAQSSPRWNDPTAWKVADRCRSPSGVVAIPWRTPF